MLPKPETEELTKKREEYTIEIRKNNRDDFLKKKRMGKLEETVQNKEKNEKNLFIESCLQRTFTYNDFHYLVECLLSHVLENEIVGIIGLRKMLSYEKNPPIQAAIDANLLPKIIELMNRNDEPSLQLESTWALTNIAMGNSSHIQSIFDRGGVKTLIGLLGSPMPEIVDQVIWALGNIAGDSIKFRDILIKEAGLLMIGRVLKAADFNHQIFRNGVWAIANLCRGKPRPDLEILKEAIPIFAKVLREYNGDKDEDVELLVESLWALSYLATGPDHIISLITNQGCVPELIKIFEKHSSNLNVLLPCNRTLGNIIAGTNEHANEVVKYGGIEIFFSLLSHEKKTIRKEACWSLSNITSENPQNINIICKTPIFIKQLLTLIATDTDEIIKEAAWVIFNCTKYGEYCDIFKIVEWGALETYENLLSSRDIRTVCIALDGIFNILMCGRKFFSQNGENIFLVKLEKDHAIHKLEELQNHPSEEVYQKVIEILETFCEIEQNL